METSDAVGILSALGSAPRLTAYRMLLQAGSDGLRSGVVARAMDVPPNTASNHLAILSRAGMVSCRREGRMVIYSASAAPLEEVTRFLAESSVTGREGDQ